MDGHVDLNPPIVCLSIPGNNFDRNKVAQFLERIICILRCITTVNLCFCNVVVLDFNLLYSIIDFFSRTNPLLENYTKVGFNG